MLWFILAVVGLGSGAAWLASEAEQRSSRTPPKVGADDPPAHGRLAKCKQSGWDKVGQAFGKVWRAGMKAAVSAVGGGTLGAAAVDAWAEKFHIGVKNLKAEERANFFNTASNEELFVWSVGWARDGYDKLLQDQHPDGNQKKARRFVEALGFTAETLHGSLEEMARDTLRTLLWYGAWAPMSMPPCMNQAAIQAHLILHYGPLSDTWEPIVRKKRQLPKGDSYVKIPAWVDGIMADLDAYRDAHGAPAPAGELGDEVDESAALRAESAAAVVGADPPVNSVEALVEFLVDRLNRNEASPADYQLETTGPTTKRLTFRFYTEFRQKHADGVLFPSYRAGSTIVQVKTALVQG